MDVMRTWDYVCIYDGMRTADDQGFAANVANLNQISEGYYTPVFVEVPDGNMRIYLVVYDAEIMFGDTDWLELINRASK